MAFVQTPIPDNEQNKQAPVGQTTPNPLAQLPPEATSTGGSAGQGGGSAGNGAAPSVGSSTQFGSSASKLSDYLSANAPQIQSMGNDIAGTLNQNYGQIQNAVDTAAQGFGQAVNAGYAAPDSALVNQAASDPTGFVKSPDNVKAFQAQYNDQYTGPQNFESTSPYADVQGQVNQAVQGAGLLGTHAGLSSYLQRNVEKNPTPGQNTLDTVLLESQPEAIKAVSDAAKPFAGLSDYLANSSKTQDALVAPAQQAAKDASDYSKNTLNPVAQQFGNTLDSQLAGINSKRDAYNAAVANNQSASQQYQAQLLQAQQDAANKYSSNVAALAGNPTSAAQEDSRIAALINPQSQINNLSAYLSGKPITTPGTMANTATADQYGEDEALSELLGPAYSNRLDKANAGQAGTYSIPGIPSVAQDPSGQIQYMNDIASLYGNPYGIQNANAPGKWNNPDPIPVAQAVLDASKNSGQGVNPDAATIAALQRLVANQYTGR